MVSLQYCDCLWHIVQCRRNKVNAGLPTIHEFFLTESEPDLTASKQCVEMYRDGRWRARPCSDAKYHVCERLPGMSREKGRDSKRGDG